MDSVDYQATTLKNRKRGKNDTVIKPTNASLRIIGLRGVLDAFIAYKNDNEFFYTGPLLNI